jgi:hypothetical protein
MAHARTCRNAAATTRATTTELAWPVAVSWVF